MHAPLQPYSKSESQDLVDAGNGSSSPAPAQLKKARRPGAGFLARVSNQIQGSARVRRHAHLQDQATRTIFRLSAPVPDHAPGILQAKWILRNGRLEEVDDNYVLQQGEVDFDMSVFQHNPQVVFDKGSKVAKYNSKGDRSVEQQKDDIPDHPELQASRLNQGKELAKRILASKDLAKETADMTKLAESLEKMAGKSVPKNHLAKVKKLAKKDFSGKQYRAVIKAQDELTQSESTSSFFSGLRSGLGNPSQQQQEFLDQALRAFSALRTPTQAVNAPIQHGNEITGQQHPTAHDQPKLPGGSSGHAFADRLRVQNQIDAFGGLAQDPNTSALTLVMGNLLSALVSTLSTMAHPNLASNVPDFNTARSDQQMQEREQMKKQANLIEPKMREKGLPPIKKRKLNAPLIPFDRATSPERDINADSDSEQEDIDVQNLPKPQKSPLPPPVQPSLSFDPSKFPPLPKLNLPPPITSQQSSQPQTGNTSSSQVKMPPQQQPSTSTQQSQTGHMGNVGQTSLLLPPLKLPTLIFDKKINDRNLHIQALSRLILQQLPQNTPNVVRGVFADISQRANSELAYSVEGTQALRHIYDQLYLAHQLFGRYIQRQLTAGDAGDSTTNVGRRVRSLEQFMLECGQLAVHNVVSLERAQADNNNFQNVHNYVGDQQALAQHGNFRNDVDEGALRTMLANAGRQGIPVIGNLAQLQGLITQYNQGEFLGNALGLANVGRMLLQQYGVGDQEANEITNFNNFLQGHTNQINFIINTNAHLFAGGYHWISVRLQRNVQGLISLFFLDSWRGQADYQNLFAALRNFIAQTGPMPQPAQNQQNQQSGSSQGGKVQKSDPSGKESK